MVGITVDLYFCDRELVTYVRDEDGNYIVDVNNQFVTV